MSLAPFESDSSGDPRSFNPIYEEGQELVNVRTHGDWMQNQEKTKAGGAHGAGILAGGLGGHSPALKTIRYYYESTTSREPLANVEDLDLYNHPLVKWQTGEALYARRGVQFRVTKAPGMAGDALAALKVCLPVFSNLGFLFDEGGSNPYLGRLRMMEKLDFVGVGHNVPSSADRTGRGTAAVGGLETLRANGTDGVKQGNYIENYFPIKGELGAGHGLDEACEGRRPISWFMPVDLSSRDPFSFHNANVALQILYNIYNDYVSAQDAEKIVSATGKWKFDVRTIEKGVGRDDHKMRMEKDDYNLLPQLYHKTLQAIIALDVQRGIDGKRGPQPAPTTPDEWVQRMTNLFTDLRISDKPDNLSLENYATGFGKLQSASHRFTEDRVRFIVGIARSTCPAGGNFDCEIRRFLC